MSNPAEITRDEFDHYQSMRGFESFFDYGPEIPTGTRCDQCYADAVVLKAIYRLSWSDWNDGGESGVANVGTTIKCMNCGRKVASHWG